MKKMFLLMLLVTIFFGMSFSQSIIVNDPHLGDNWEKGSINSITWTKVGDMNSNVKITLYDFSGATLIQVMTMNTPNDGSYLWTIENSIPNGSYIVRVKTVDNAIFDNSDIFSIGTSFEPTPSINLTSPNGGENWINRSTHNVSWTPTGITGNVTVELIKIFFGRPSYSTAKALYTGSASTGSFSWTINENLKSSLQIGSKVKVENTYKIRITSVNNSSIKDMSDGVFKITPKRIVLGQIKPDFEVKDIFYKGSGGNSIVAKVINNGFKYNGHLTLKYDLRSGESGAVSQVVAMNRGEIKNINILSRTLGLCDKLSINVEVDSNKSINESNENNNMKHKNVFASSQSDAKIESVKVFSDDGRWVAVQNGGFIQKRSRSIRMQVTVRNCGGTRIEGAKVGANWDFISHWLSIEKKKKKGYPNSSVFYEDVKKWLPCHSILKKIQELSNKSIRPGSAKTFIINGDLRRDSCPGNTIKIIKNEVTVYFDNGESGYKKKNNILKFRISH